MVESDANIPPEESTLEAGDAQAPLLLESGQTTSLSEVSDNDRLLAGLAWITMVLIQFPLMSVILLLLKETRERPFQRYHAVTSIIFWVAALVYGLLAGTVYAILSVITLGCLSACLWVIFFLPHIAAIFYGIQAFTGKYPEIPFISEFAQRMGWVVKPATEQS